MIKLNLNHRKIVALLILTSFILLNSQSIAYLKENDLNSNLSFDSRTSRFQQTQIDLKYINNSAYRNLTIYGPELKDYLGLKQDITYLIYSQYGMSASFLSFS